MKDIETIVKKGEPTKESALYTGRKYCISIEQNVKGVEQSYLIINTLENFAHYLPSLYEVNNYLR